MPILHDSEVGVGGGRCGVGLVNLKVIAVWASTLPSLPLSTRSALLSKFLSGGNREGVGVGGWGGQLKTALTRTWPKPPPSSC